MSLLELNKFRKMSVLNLFNPKCQSQKNNNIQMMSDWEFVIVIYTKWRALIGRKIWLIFSFSQRHCCIFSTMCQQLTSFSTTELLKNIWYESFWLFRRRCFIYSFTKTKMCLIIPYEEKKFITNFWTNFFPILQKSQS